jgi:hypothetical protein
MKTDLMKSDGFDIDANDRLIRGDLLKCNDGRWTQNGEAVGGEQRFLVIGTAECVQRWRDGKAVETITTKPLPDVAQLNSTVPEEDWEEGIAGPRPPWQRQRAIYLVRTTDGNTFTYVSGTIGAQIASDSLVDRVATMRRLRGQDVLPLVGLGSKTMKTKYGQRLRPEFIVDGWRQIGSTGETKAVEHKTEIGKPVTPPTIKEELNDAVAF